MVQPPQRSPLSKMIRDKYFGLFILCKNNQYAGMYPASLSEILETSITKAKYIIDLTEFLVDDLELFDVNKITQVIMTLNEIVVDPPEQESFNSILKIVKNKSSLSLITAYDIAEILEINFSFALELYNSYDNVIDTEEDLEAFLFHIEDYLNEHYQGAIPNQHKTQKNQIQKDNQKLQFNKQRLEEILSQEAPLELRPDSIIQPLQQEEFDEQNDEFQQDDSDLSLQSDRSPYFDDVSQALQQTLDISKEESDFLLSSAQSLSDFLEINDIEEAESILDAAMQGDISLLLSAVEARVQEIKTTVVEDAVVEELIKTEQGQDNFHDQHQKQNMSPSQISKEQPTSASTDTYDFYSTSSKKQTPNKLGHAEQQSQFLPSEAKTENTFDVPIDDLISDNFLNTEAENSVSQESNNNQDYPQESDQGWEQALEPTEVVDQLGHDDTATTASHYSPIDQNLQIPAEYQKPERILSNSHENVQADSQVELPDNLGDTLLLAFQIKQRITAKSLSQAFELFDVPISQSLARFIIEEGGYGGVTPNIHRIMTVKMVEKMIADINNQGGLRPFVKKYLEKINNDLKSMLSGGG